MVKSLIIKYKHRIGDVFYDPERDETIQIEGYNSIANNIYKGVIYANFGYGTNVRLESNMLYESRLDKMEKYRSLKELELAKMKKDIKVNYKIYYFDNPLKKGEQAKTITITLSGVTKLAKVLNTMKKRNPARRISMVCIVDDNDRYIDYVKFLKQEMAKQQWLTGMKERLLAHAKYERGFEIATNF
jgi:hypothetical protein